MLPTINITEFSLSLTKFKEMAYRLFNKNIAESVIWMKYPYLSLILSFGIAYTSYYVLSIAKVCYCVYVDLFIWVGPVELPTFKKVGPPPNEEPFGKILPQNCGKFT